MRQSLMDTFNEMYILDLHGNSLKKKLRLMAEKTKMFSISVKAYP